MIQSQVSATADIRPTVCNVSTQSEAASGSALTAMLRLPPTLEFYGRPATAPFETPRATTALDVGPTPTALCFS